MRILCSPVWTCLSVCRRLRLPRTSRKCTWGPRTSSGTWCFQLWATPLILGRGHNSSQTRKNCEDLRIPGRWHQKEPDRDDTRREKQTRPTTDTEGRMPNRKPYQNLIANKRTSGEQNGRPTNHSQRLLQNENQRIWNQLLKLKFILEQITRKSKKSD